MEVKCILSIFPDTDYIKYMTTANLLFYYILSGNARFYVQDLNVPQLPIQ